MTRPLAKAFTLIELLIVVAIIAILAAIAVPNFLEAQTRSKIARSQADMRTIVTGMELYIIDFNNEPKALAPEGFRGPDDFSAWWGFLSAGLTTPIAYITSLPVMTFTDETVARTWRDMGGGQGNQPYTFIRDMYMPAYTWPVGGNFRNAAAPASVLVSPYPQEFADKARTSGYVVYTGGADGVDGTVWGSVAIYDATNGTISYGDVFRFGGSAPKDSSNAERN